MTKATPKSKGSGCKEEGCGEEEGEVRDETR